MNLPRTVSMTLKRRGISFSVLVTSSPIFATDLEAARPSSVETISEAFSLTGAEAKVAAMIAAGASQRRSQASWTVAGNGAEPDQGNFRQDRDASPERVGRVARPDSNLSFAGIVQQRAIP
ncbi:MAG: hypothetical protein E6501_11180, partial [Bradyrhizobium sp.]|nr:hypothetical protein [Bradyrhizobium sp.]